ncbi:SDR family NAD(P)-dependent oxidoreductase [Cellulomonas citrea]|uniref:SDR family NAD(P)-dependent oxidoreductase n=1 Tax=Cellulomonas citrea TaxID=1909423 RepID=UPI00135B5E04|nr:SDR family oxidoreductase [Cellulomonas citrea]
MSARRYLVTGASSGIGAATVRAMRAAGWDVLATARRADRLAELAEETGALVHPADVTSDADVAALVAFAEQTGGLDGVVNNAGGAYGLDPVESGSIDDWRLMYELNVLGTLRVTQGVLPLLRARGGGDVLVVTSTAAIGAYPGGAGYTGAKHAERLLAETLRWELAGEPVRVLQIQPGAVATEEFSLVRFGGDAERAAKVYDGYQPLSAQDVAEAMVWMLSRPAHVNIDSMTIRPIAQATNTLTVRS